MAGRVRTAAPATRVCTLAEAQLQTRSSNASEEARLLALIDAATEIAEAYTRRRFITQSWRWTDEDFDDEICLPYPPLQSVESVKYIATDGTLTTVSTSVYDVRTDETPGEIVLAYGQVWPVPRAQEGAVRVEFTCGYGAAASAVPAAIRQAVLLLVQYMYDGDPMTNGIPPAVATLLGPYRVSRPGA